MSARTSTLRVAAVQAAPSFLNLEETVEKACGLIIEAGTQGADLIVFPEVFISGYCHWLHYYPAGHPMSINLNRELFKNTANSAHLVVGTDSGLDILHVGKPSNELLVYLTVNGVWKKDRTNF